MSIYMCVCCDTCGAVGHLTNGGEYPAGWGRTDGHDHCAFDAPGASQRREQLLREKLEAQREAEAKAKAWDEQPIRRMLPNTYVKFPQGQI